MTYANISTTETLKKFFIKNFKRTLTQKKSVKIKLLVFIIMFREDEDDNYHNKFFNKTNTCDRWEKERMEGEIASNIQNIYLEKKNIKRLEVHIYNIILIFYCLIDIIEDS